VRILVALFAAAVLLAGCGSSDNEAGEPLRITVRSAPPAYIGERYEAKFPASGGVRPYNYEIDGKLPPGLSFNNGRLSGTPRKKGDYKITIIVSDAALSNRSASFTLRVNDPPPPELHAKLPESETEAPFIAVFTLSERPATALRIRLAVKDLKPDLTSLKTAPDLVYVIRYNAKGQTIDLDGVFTKTFTGGEVFRLKLEPARKVRPKVKVQTQFYDAKGSPYTKTPPKRPADKGAYSFEELRALAAALGKKTVPRDIPPELGGLGGLGGFGGAPLQPPPPSGNSAATPPADSSSAPKRSPASGDGSGTSAPPQTGSSSAPPATGPDKPPSSPEERAAGPGPGDKNSPAPSTPSVPTQSFHPDLNSDGKVDAADLELLRKDYAFNPGGRYGVPSAPAKPAPGSEDGGKKSPGDSGNGMREPDEEDPEDTKPGDMPPKDVDGIFPGGSGTHP